MLLKQKLMHLQELKLKRLTCKKCITSKYFGEYINQLDYVIVCCPLNKDTENFINKKNLRLMKKSAVIINIARGDIINEEDFYLALKNNIIGGGIIDTWYRYPVNKNKLKIQTLKVQFPYVKQCNYDASYFSLVFKHDN